MNFESIVTAFKDGFTWLVDIIKNPLAGWAFTIVLAVSLYVIGDNKYDKGVLAGEKNSVQEIKSLAKSVTNYQIEATRNAKDADRLQKKLDTCNAQSGKPDIAKMLKVLQDAEDMKAAFNRRKEVVNSVNSELENNNKLYKNLLPSN